MILDKKQNFSLKPLSVACLLAMSISGCSSGSGSQPSTVQVTDVLGAENVSQEDQPTTSEGIGSGVEQPVAPSAPITDQPPVNLELDHDDSSSNDGGLSSGIADHGNTSPTEDSLLDSNDATVLENNDVNQPDTIPTVESPPSEAEQPVDVVAPPAVEPVLTDTVLVDSAIQDIEVPQDTSEVEMGSTIQEPEPSQDTLEVETGSAFLETPATNDEAADIQMDAAIIDAAEAEEHYFDPAALLQQPSYVAPVSTAQLSKPQYVRAVQAELQNAQPQASAGTLAGYAVMDSSNNSNLTEAMYGLSEADYAAELGALKTKIDTRNMHVGVIDTGIDPNNPDLNNVNLHDSQVVCTQNPLCYYSEQGLENLSYTDHQASHDHGSQMAAIIAGNNGLSNARIYGSDSIDSGSNGGNQFLIISKINRDSQGEVKIFNNSWGGDNSGLWTQLTRNERYDAATGVGNGDLATVHDLILNRDVLLLKATGNEGLDNSSDENLLPDFNPRFKEGFIAVSAPREDFSGANLCGDAAEWCLAAPSSTQNYSNSGQLQNYKGTSPATARVTGTAVLVKAAYPWMKNHNLVQTILGTAKDFDDIRAESPTYRGIVQVDEVPEHVWSYWRDGQGNFYIEGEAAWENRNRNSRDHHGKTITYESGWGLLDTVAATQGYGGFYWDDVQLDTAGIPVSVFSNDLKGNKGFTKSGEGKLVFMGNNQYLGDSIIRGGVLEINGNNGPSKFQLHAGELTGYGSISDVQQTGGWLNNEGNLTITGNYSMQIAADQQQHAGFKARFGNLLTVTGTANLAGTLNLFDEVPLDQPLITAQGSQTTVLRAQQGVQREFDAYRSSNPLFELTQVSYRPELNATGEPVRAADTINTDVVITAKRKSTETVAALATELEGRTQVARNLDVVLASLDQKQQLETLEDAEKVFANRLFNNFAQTIRYRNAAESTVSTQALNQLFHQLDPSFYANTVLNVAEESSKQERQFAQRLATAQPKQLWFSGDYQSYDMDYVGLNSERRSHHQGVGVATKLAGMTLAAQADFSQLDLDDTVQTGSKNSSQSKAYALTLGTAQQLNRDLSVAAWLKGMQVDVDAQRGHAQAQKIQFDGQMYAAGLRLDYSYPLSQKMQIQPYLDASFQHYVHAEQTQQDAVNSLDDLVMQRWNLGTGLQANYQLNPAWQLQGSLYYSQPIQEKAYLDTHYVGTTEQLTFDAWHADQGQYHAALGSQLHFGQHSFINLNYEYSGRSHSDSYRVQLAVTTRF